MILDDTRESNEYDSEVQEARAESTGLYDKGVFISSIYVFVVFVVTLNRSCVFLYSADLNSIGDFLAGLFAPIAFLWLFISIRMQSLELKIQAIELRRNRQHQEQIATASKLSLAEFTPNFYLRIVSINAVRYNTVTIKGNQRSYDSFDDESKLSTALQGDNTTAKGCTFDFSYELENLGAPPRSFVNLITTKENMPPNSAVDLFFDKQQLDRGEKTKCNNILDFDTINPDPFQVVITIFGYDGIGVFFRQNFIAHSSIKIDDYYSGASVSPYDTPKYCEIHHDDL